MNLTLETKWVKFSSFFRLRLPFGRRISTTSAALSVNFKDYQLAGHPPESFHLRWTDPQPIQEHGRDIKLRKRLLPEEVKGPRLDKLYKTIELEVLAYEPATLDSYEWFVVAAATHLGINIGKRWQPKKPDHHRFNLLRSAFVHKKHQVHYEVRTYHRFILLHKLTGSTADTFLEYIQRNLPEGVGMKVTKFEVVKLPDYIAKPDPTVAAEGDPSEAPAIAVPTS